MNISKLLLTLSIAAIASPYALAALRFDGTTNNPVVITPNASSGLESVYVIDGADGVSISYDGDTAVKWYKFSSAGASYAEELGTSTSINVNNEDSGYIVETGGRQYYYWIVNYLNHPLCLESVSASPESDCANVLLDIKGSADRMLYYTINGRGVEIDREISIDYNTLEYVAESNSYRLAETSQQTAYLRTSVALPASLCDTQYRVTGDRFLKSWGREQSVETDMVAAQAVSAETSAEQNRIDIDNEQSSDDSELGGSAPCEIEFTAAVTDAAVFYEWQLSRNSDFDPIDDRYPQTDLNYTFRDQGTTYVRFFAANESGKCEYIGTTYAVNIGASSLLCPNAFTPETSPGVNDEWKVSYKSIIDFECHIFNRWGLELFSFKDPSVGWDGKYKGKYVPAGVYYYIIKARGADGRDYKLSGDINIIKSKDPVSSGNDE